MLFECMLRLVYVLPFFAFGCFGSTPAIGEDAGSMDVSSADVSAADVPTRDTGPLVFDAGPPPPPRIDAGPPPTEDAGPPPMQDAGPPPVEDAGPPPVEDAGPEVQLDEACDALCDAALDCGIIGLPGECVPGCLAFGMSRPTCAPAAAAFFECSRRLDCMSLLTAFDDGRAGTCGSEFVDLERDCPPITP